MNEHQKACPAYPVAIENVRLKTCLFMTILGIFYNRSNLDGILLGRFPAWAPYSFFFPGLNFQISALPFSAFEDAKCLVFINSVFNADDFQYGNRILSFAGVNSQVSTLTFSKIEDTMWLIDITSRAPFY